MAAGDNEEVLAPTIAWKVLQVFSISLRVVSIVLIGIAVNGLREQEARQFNKNQQAHTTDTGLSDFLLDGKCVVYTIPQQQSATLEGTSGTLANITTGVGFEVGVSSDHALSGPCGWFDSTNAYAAHLQEEWNGNRGCDPQMDESQWPDGHITCCINCQTDDPRMYNLFPPGGLEVYLPNLTAPVLEAYVYFSLLALKIWSVVRTWRKKKAWSFFDPSCLPMPRKAFFNSAMFFVISYLPGVVFAPVMSAKIHDGKYFEVELYSGVLTLLIALTLVSQIIVQILSALQCCCDLGKFYAGAMEICLTLPVWFVPLMIWSMSFSFNLNLVFSFDISWSIGLVTCFVQVFQTLALCADALAQLASRIEMIRKVARKAHGDE